MDFLVCDPRVLRAVRRTVGVSFSGAVRRRQSIVFADLLCSSLPTDRLALAAQNQATIAGLHTGVTLLLTFPLCLHYPALAAKISWTSDN